MRPLATRPEGLEDRLGTIAELTGLDGYTVRQKLVGTALETLVTGADEVALGSTARILRQQGVAAWLVSKAEIVRGEPARRCTSLEFGADTIQFVAPDGNRIAALRRGDRCLLVLGALDFRSFQQKLMARRALDVVADLGLDEVLRSVFANDPVLDVYLPGQEVAVRIHGRRFDFTCLGERNRLAIGTNFPTVLDALREMAGEATLDTSFGLVQHPFLHWPEPHAPEMMLRQFQVYSRFLCRAFRE
ncbi:MAG TPA: hypothetical protein VK997_02565, partial [Deferrisomatales bacterium]|nr:hypothetical protein [Deferrisomatales bacterium]